MNIRLTLKQRVKIVCNKVGITLTELSKRIGSTPSLFTQRLDNEKFTKDELCKIAMAAGCEYISMFSFPDGKNFSALNIGDQIKEALAYANMTAIELGAKFGWSQQVISKRMCIGKFTQKDLEKIGETIGCKYISEFHFDDGDII